MRDYKGKTKKLLPFYMTDFLFTELQSHSIWRKSKYHMKNYIPDIPSRLYISDSNLLHYEFHHIVIKCYDNVMKWNLWNVKKKHLTWLKLYLIIISDLEINVNKQKKKNICHSVPKAFHLFSEILCSISSNHFLPFNFMCTFYR